MKEFRCVAEMAARYRRDACRLRWDRRARAAFRVAACSGCAWLTLAFAAMSADAAGWLP